MFRNRHLAVRLQMEVSAWVRFAFPQVWISFAQFELSAGREENLSRCRQIYEEANKAMRNCEEKEERVMLLESWRSFEEEFGTETTKERIEKLMPEKIKKRRKLQAEDGVRGRTMQVVALAAFCWGLVARTKLAVRVLALHTPFTAGIEKKHWPETCAAELLALRRAGGH